MKKLLALLFAFAGRIGRPGVGRFHDDTLRANHGDASPTAFSYWRSLVG